MKNSTQLIKDLQEIPYNQNLRLTSFDKIGWNNQIDSSIIDDITKLTKTITNQNYFQFMKENYVQAEGLAMGAPTSAILSEIYLQFLENSVIYNILKTHNIEGYFRYVDDVLNEFNQITPKLKFTIEEELQQKINFLDITIQRKQHRITTNIYRKPTSTDSIIPNDSCHPKEHKMAAIHYLYNRMYTYNLTTTDLQKEKDIHQILINNKYDPISIQDSEKKKKGKKEGDHLKQNAEKTKWAKFTYTGKETKFITKIFKKSNIKIALTTNNTIGKLLTTKQEKATNKYDKSGIYQLKCPTCDKKYIGQTSRPFKIRFQEHIRDFKYNNRKSKFAQHLLDRQHSIDSMENIMDIICITDKGKMMDTIEKYYIYRETKLNDQLNDRLTVQPNIIFETIVQQDSYRGLCNARSQQT
jgi:hypothetical protein